MAMITLDCARCGAKRMTHDIQACSVYRDELYQYEYFCQCRICNKSAVWKVGATYEHAPPDRLISEKGAVDELIGDASLVRPRVAALQAPEHTPPELKLMFDEGANCIGINAWNASSAMFRKILDQISKEKMDAAPGGPPADRRTQFNLKPRLKWLFDNGHLPQALAPLADAIREDANDGVHNAPIGEVEALDIQDFTVEVLETLYTLPGRLREAEARRAQRRAPPSP